MRRTGLRRDFSRAVVGIAAMLGISQLLGCDVKRGELTLPCDVNGIRWEMTAEQLIAVRPAARWSESSGAYHEQVQTCGPFVTDVGYVFERHGLSLQKTLDSVGLGTELHHTDSESVRSLGEGLVTGSVALWGEPSGVEVFTRPKFENTEYWNVGLWWKREWGDVYGFYSSPVALPKCGEDVCATISVTVSRDGIDEFRAWSQGVTDPVIVGRHFSGIPSAVKKDIPVFQ